MRMAQNRRVASSAGMVCGHNAAMWEEQLPAGATMRGFAVGYRPSSAWWSTTAVISALGLSCMNRSAIRLWSTSANFLEGNGVGKDAMSDRERSCEGGSEMPARLSA